MRARGFFVSLLLCLGFSPHAQAQFNSSDLPLPTGSSSGTATGISSGEAVGSATLGAFPHGVLWNGAANSIIDLDPGKFGSRLAGIQATSQFGYYGASQYTYSYGGGRGGRIHHVTITLWHAAVWHGSNQSIADLNPAGAAYSYALGAYGNKQAGAAVFAGAPLFDGPEYAYVWSGTSASAVNIDNGYTWSQANCVGSANIGGVGSGAIGGNPHAILWTGPTYTIVDLHPAAYPTYSSDITCLDDRRNQQGGFLYIYDSATGSYDETAFLWHGVPNGISLAPAGSTSSEVLAVNGGYQAGWATIGGVQHAFVWKDTAASAIDLGPGVANGIDANHDIIGTSGGLPAIWKLAAVPHLSVTQSAEPDTIGWNNGRVTFGVHSPFTTGTPTITYHWDSAAPATVLGSSLTTTQRGNGNRHLYVSASDGTKTTSTSVLTVNIDTLPPVTNEKLATGSFTLTASDAGCGVATTYYSLDGGLATAYIGPVAVTNVVHSLKYWSVDKVGNAEGAHVVTLPIEPPSISGITPGYALAGSSDITIYVNGADFASTSAVLWNGKPLKTAYVSSAQLTAVIPAADMVDPSTDQISVTTPGPAGGTSVNVVFQVVDN